MIVIIIELSAKILRMLFSNCLEILFFPRIMNENRAIGTKSYRRANLESTEYSATALFPSLAPIKEVFREFDEFSATCIIMNL
jgi:hypothetical protein